MAVTSVTVSTVNCVSALTTGAADGSKTDVAVAAADDVDEEASVTTEAAAAILGGAITLEITVVAEFVTAVVVGVIVTLNVGCANRLETGSVAIKRLESNEMWAAVGDTNERCQQTMLRTGPKPSLESRSAGRGSG